jgi:phage terminase large subunit-like protein
MTTLVVPGVESELWPTLGPQVAAWMERYLVHGPGDLRGQPYRLDVEKRALLYRMYEVYPPDHPQAGRRRFRRAAISVRKGWGKTEFAAAIAAAELHPRAPVRCVGWDAAGQPIGGGLGDVYIPLVAYTEEQSDDLAYATLRVMLGEGPLRDEFDIGLERIMRLDGSGKAVSLASSPDARDGARTTFMVCDETHRWTLPRLRTAHQVMLANLPKRRLADAWMLEITTAPAPGEGSVAEATMEYARLVHAQERQDSRLFFYHRQASDHHDLETEEGLRAAVLEASGPVAEWSDIEGIVEQFRDPTADRAYLERVWLNRLVRASARAFDIERWRALARPDVVVPDGALVTLGFDGARSRDATAIVGTVVETGHQFVVGLWEPPLRAEGWQVPEQEVDQRIAEAFGRWQVWRLYADPVYWESWVAAWAGRYGEERVIRWPTYRALPMARAIRAYVTAIDAGHLSHDGSRDLERHLGNAYRRAISQRDERGEPYWLIEKERPDSPHKMDLAMAAVLSWEARLDAVREGARPRGPSVYERRSLLVL